MYKRTLHPAFVDLLVPYYPRRACDTNGGMPQGGGGGDPPEVGMLGFETVPVPLGPLRRDRCRAPQSPTQPLCPPCGAGAENVLFTVGAPEVLVRGEMVAVPFKMRSTTSQLYESPLPLQALLRRDVKDRIGARQRVPSGQPEKRPLERG